MTIIIKKTKFALLFACVISLTSSISVFADVSFEIIYTDEPGDGFHIRPEARKSLEEAVALVFSWLDHDAFVKIKVESFIDPDETHLAEAKANNVKEAIVPDIYHAHLARKILFNECENDLGYYARIRVNFYDEDKYAYGDRLMSNQQDFKSLIMHELTHNLGFTSWINDDVDFESACLELTYLYYQKLEVNAENNVCYEVVRELIDSGVSADWMLLNYNNEDESFTYFDTFLVDDQGNKVIDTENFKFLRKDLFKLEDEDPEKTLYFPVEDNGVVKLYPLNGIDASHLKQPADRYALMAPGLFRGVAFTQWPPLERAIMQALGYKLKPVQEGSWVWQWIGDNEGDGVIWKVTMDIDGVISKKVVEDE